MSKLQLSLAFGRNLRTDPLLTGRVGVEGVDLIPTSQRAGETFWRQLTSAAFDISEMSMSSLLMVVDRGGCDWVAVPTFATRDFFHTRPYVRRDAGINVPQDLRGKRVGIPEYQMTAGLWTRGVFQHHFGVSPTDLTWFMERLPRRSHGGAVGFQPPKGISLTYVPEGDSIAGLLHRGEIDAVTMYGGESLLDRSAIDIRNDPAIRRLFPDPLVESKRYYEQTSIFPINHTAVIRRSLAEKHPWLPVNVYQAFLQAKRIGEAELWSASSDYLKPGTGSLPDHDVMPYGISQNRHVLETLFQYSHEQGLTSRLIGLDEVFHPSSLEL